MKSENLAADRTLLKGLGERIKECRKKINYSQEELAFHSNLDRSYLGSVERGERNISIINVQKIAKALDVKISDLFNELE